MAIGHTVEETGVSSRDCQPGADGHGVPEAVAAAAAMAAWDVAVTARNAVRAATQSTAVALGPPLR
jgi:hypothetical protein